MDVALAIAVTWLTLSVLVAVIFGRGIALADRRRISAGPAPAGRASRTRRAKRRITFAGRRWPDKVGRGANRLDGRLGLVKHQFRTF
jgi:hypothetical protein